MSTRLRDLSPVTMCTTRDGSLNGSPRRNKSFIKLKTAVFAPMASASVTTAMMVKPGVLASVRSAYLKSETIRIRYNSLGDSDGKRGRLARCFWRPRQKPTTVRISVCLAHTRILSREAHDTAGEAPALARSCPTVFIRHEGQ